MSSDIVCGGEYVRVCFDFLEVDDQSGAVRTRIDVDYTGVRQSLRWTVDAVWFEYTALRNFQQGLESETSVTLHDMSDYPVFTLVRSSEGDQLTLNPRASRLSSDGGALFVQIEMEAGFVDRVHMAFANYARWW